MESSKNAYLANIWRKRLAKEKHGEHLIVLELVHSDMMGPFPYPSMRKSKYILTFINDYSRHNYACFLKQTSEFFGHFQDFKELCREAI